MGGAFFRARAAIPITNRVAHIDHPPPLPAQPVHDTLQRDGSGATGLRTITIDETLSRGVYWLAGVPQGPGGGSAAWRQININGAVDVPSAVPTGANPWISRSQESVSGALPDPAASGATRTFGVLVWLRRSA